MTEPAAPPEETSDPSLHNRRVMTRRLRSLLSALGIGLLLVSEAAASQAPGLDRILRWRSIGPDRGGRSIAVAGHKARPFEYYFGATGGGLWKTTDGGSSWFPVTDGQIRSASVGAVAVADSNPDVVYIGMGETELRANVLQGDGIYRSSDAGRSWQHLGLEKTRAISRVRIDPRDPDRVYVAALGDPFAPSSERGVFRTLDGGRSWEKILYRSDRVGAVDLVLDPGNPEVLYATLWEVQRKPWQLWSGGAGSGIFKSTDSGNTWQELTRTPGFPTGPLGKITVTVSGASSSHVWANVEAEKGGLYRSQDAGESWKLINNNRDLWQRAFYFLRIQADPRQSDTLYVLNFNLVKSTDGGRTFKRIPETHADHHDLWIDPTNPQRMINGNDGGAVVTVNGGQSWTGMRYPTAQIYRLATTADFPYHACGAQQDNSTVCVSSEASQLRDPGSPATEWMYGVGGGESGYVAPHGTDPNIFFAGATNTLTRYDRRTGLAVDVQPYPRIVMGEPAEVMPERWNWTYPIAISTVDPKILLAGSQHLWMSEDEGRTWRKISPDLTRAEPDTLKDSGGPIVKDQDGPEIYGTLYSIAPSRFDVETIWTGSDDGLVQVTRDGGDRWSNVTPPGLPPHSRVTSIEPSPHRPGSAYIAAIRYEMGDRSPQVWKTRDYGGSWARITRGIPEDDFVRVVREDPQREGLLYAGSEHGVFVSFNDGEDWSGLSLNLPETPVMGLEVKDRDLVIATHGRSFWVLDDIGILRRLEAGEELSGIRLFRPPTAIRRTVPAVIDYFLEEPVEDLRLEILDSSGKLVRLLDLGDVARPGLHRVNWNLRYEGAVSFPGIVLEGGDPRRGPWAPPGRYQVRMVVGGKELVEEFELVKDPRLPEITDQDLREQFELAIRIRDAETLANQAVILFQQLERQVQQRLELASDPALPALAHQFLDQMRNLAGRLYQLRNQSPKDKIAFPIQLNDRLTGLRSALESGDQAPPAAFSAVFDELSAELRRSLEAMERAFSRELPRLNGEFERLGLDPIELKFPDWRE